MERTTEEIVARIRELGTAKDFLGFERAILMQYLILSDAKQLLSKSVTEEEWSAAGGSASRTRKAVLTRMLTYMPFAWEKANNCRGLSANRSISHMSAWLWMLGEDHAAEAIREFTKYGKPQLRAICEAFGWRWSQWDDAKWRDGEDDPGIPAPQVPPVDLKISGGAHVS